VKPNEVRDWQTPLLVGEDRATTRRALLLAVGFVAVLPVVEYAYLPMGLDVAVLGEFLRAFVVEPNPTLALERGALGALVVMGLAGIHAALNEGFLPSLVLAVAPVYGLSLWLVVGTPGNPRIAFDPVGALGRVGLDAVMLATVGFLLGLGFRRLRRRSANRPDEHSA
jgi:hypothetical protein